MQKEKNGDIEQNLVDFLMLFRLSIFRQLEIQITSLYYAVE